MFHAALCGAGATLSVKLRTHTHTHTHKSQQRKINAKCNPQLHEGKTASTQAGTLTLLRTCVCGRVVLSSFDRQNLKAPQTLASKCLPCPTTTNKTSAMRYVDG
ncbi:hypothetical protein TRVL_01008 [Trypanosoma vivax]|nr:hypothetical protein TRVL_01008 [Trypanosoma vivax]